MPTKVLVIQAGETGIIRKNVKITSVGIIGGALPTSTCVNIQNALNNAVEYECFQIRWAVEFDSNNRTGPWSHGDPNARVIQFGYADKVINMDIDVVGDNGADLGLSSELMLAINNQVLEGVFVDMDLIGLGNVGERGTRALIFKADPALAATAYLKFKLPDYDDVKLYAVPSTLCPPEDTSSESA